MTGVEVTELERSAARAWPSLEARSVAGWLCRTAGGYTRRANSCLPLENPGDNLADRIAEVEAWYASEGLPAVFKVPAHPLWSDLDAALARRGYTEEAPSRVLSRPARPVPAPEGFEESGRFEADWLAGYWEANESPEAHRSVSQTLAELTSQPLVGRIKDAGADAAWAFVSIDGPRGWVFDVVVDPARRRRGLGSRLMTGLEAGAARRGVRTVYLQVLGTNSAARALYGSLGWEDAFGYHYRRQP